jgi:rhodanese-related sulfurtransferase
MTELVTRTELKALMEKGDVYVVDALGGMYFEKQHLPGAVPLVADDVADHASELLPDKAAPIVTYCSNEACPNSGNVATLLTKVGYTNVRKYKEGIQDWVDAGLPTESGSVAP